LDRKRKKRTSNKEWMSPTDTDARVTKMKDGRTHLAHKAEHAVDLDTGAVVAVTLREADKGDTTIPLVTSPLASTPKVPTFHLTASPRIRPPICRIPLCP